MGLILKILKSIFFLNLNILAGLRAVPPQFNFFGSYIKSIYSYQDIVIKLNLEEFANFTTVVESTPPHR